MTNNIEKLYELAGMEKRIFSFVIQGEFPQRVHDRCYPPFTDTKQLELIKWLASEQNDIEISWYSDIGFRINNFLDSCEHKDFPQALAGLVCELWNDLTDTQKEEIRGILQ